MIPEMQKDKKEDMIKMTTGYCLIVTGGEVELDFAKEVLNARKYDFLIGADKGVEFFYKENVMPTHIVGDFDSLKRDIFEKFAGNPNVTVRMFSPIKDYTDTELAIKLAMELGAKGIWIVGANGKRVDHTISNIQSLCVTLEKGIPCVLTDKHNEIRVIDGTSIISKEEAFGKYLSVFPLGKDIEKFTIEGVKYPMHNEKLSSYGSKTVSNEITEEFVKIIFSGGRVILILSKD